MEVRGNEILVPVDFTLAAKYGVNNAINLANRLNTNIHLVNFIPPPDANKGKEKEEEYDFSEALRSSINLLKENQTKLTELVHEIDGSENIHSEIKMDKFARGIKKQLKNQNIGLIVMGLNGHLSIGDSLCQNKKANEIIRSGCPVLVCNENVNDFNQSNSIVVSMDEDSFLDDNFDKFLRISRNLFKKWYFVHVNHSNDKKTWSKSGIEQFLAKHQVKPTSVQIIESSDKEQAILEYADAKNAGCLAVNRHGKTSSFSDCKVEEIVSSGKFPVFIY
ncbi:universal stress protein [Fulvivirga ligni]|uniref:universal stress protein n=1 Tax=Fulvivirga ligni TaxID=2904246 RepID=UPI001F15D967|nr:universal stress protein [Fulvivirga ligni]UII19231.1 universal stress protein [Fulvivirga ligni]